MTIKAKSKKDFIYYTCVVSAMLALQSASAAPLSADRAKVDPAKTPASPVKTAASAEGFELYQTSTVKGDFDVFISSQGVKIFDRKNITGVVAKPPLWDIYSYNNVTRRVCKQSFKNYKGMGKAADDTTGGANMLALPLTKGNPVDLHGLKAIMSVTAPAYEKQQLKDLAREAADPRFVKSAEMYYAAKAPAPTQAITILSRFYDVPDTASIPLQFKYVSLKDELHTLLITNTMQPMRTWQNGFDAPAAEYKMVSDPTRLEDKPKYVPLRKSVETVRKHPTQNPTVK